MEGIRTLNKLEAQAESSIEVDALIASYYDALNDDLNTPILIAQLYETIGYANKVQAKQESLNAADLQRLQHAVNTMVFDILGLQEEQEAGSQKLDGLMELLLELRAQAKAKKDWATSDAIRDRLAALGIQVKDSKTGSSWTLY